jgi:hypothetical protein
MNFWLREIYFLIFYILVLFNDVFTKLRLIIAPNGRLLMNNEFDRKWKEAVVAYLKAFPRYFLEELDETYKILK